MKRTVGLLGTKHPHASAYLELLDSLKAIETVVLCPAVSENEATSSDNEEVSGEGPRRVRTVDELCQDQSISAVVALLPPSEVPETVGKLMKSGKSVLLEKPGALTSREFERLQEEAKNIGVGLWVSYPYRYHPVVSELRRMITEGELGRLIGFELRWTATQPRFRDPTSWLFSREKAGGGVLAWLGCHLIDALQFIGNEDYASVTGMTAIRSGASITVEDTACFAAQLQSGATGTMNFGYHIAHGEAGYMGTTYDTRLSINGSEGRVVWDPKGERSDSFWTDLGAGADAGGDGRLVTMPVPHGAGYGGSSGQALVTDFLEACAIGHRDRLIDRMSLETLRFIEKAYTAAESSGGARP